MESGVTRTPVRTAADYNRHFDAKAYLEHFYGEDAMRQGMRLMLFVLPNFAAKIQQELGRKASSVLDVGSGPTVYVALCLREAAESLDMADYAAQSLQAVRPWLEGQQAGFSWAPVAACIARNEGISGSELLDKSLSPKWRDRMETQARQLIQGLWRCDVLSQDLRLEGVSEEEQIPAGRKYEVVVSIFCLESACTDYDQYRKAMANIAAKVSPGGFLIIGSVLEDHTYEFRDSKTEHCFELLYLSEKTIVSTIRDVGLTVREPVIVEAGAVAVLAKKESLLDTQ